MKDKNYNVKRKIIFSLNQIKNDINRIEHVLLYQDNVLLMNLKLDQIDSDVYQKMNEIDFTYAFFQLTGDELIILKKQ